jgi:cobalamin biosynthesis protein CobD/CbiB
MDSSTAVPLLLVIIVLAIFVVWVFFKTLAVAIRCNSALGIIMIFVCFPIGVLVTIAAASAAAREAEILRQIYRRPFSWMDDQR